MSFTIYKGIWTNWSHGLVAGTTLTLDERDGGLLTAFLAIFVSAAGAATWSIMSYALHQIRAKQEHQDGLHHQQQAILRNSRNPVGAAWQLMQLTWYWRSSAKRCLVRTLPLAGLPLLNVVLFGVAGVFSSEVTKAPGNETLIRSPNCGFLNLTSDPKSIQGQAAFNSMDLNDTLPAAAYQRACYGNVESSLQCGQYIQRQLRWTSNRNAPCPFSSKICLSGNTTAYAMDTGLIDTHESIGINARKEERAQYRKVTTCAPIQTKDYGRAINDTKIDSPTKGDTLIQYFYGNSEDLNHTYQYNTHSLVEEHGYELVSFFANSAWTPIDALRRTDADVSLFLLAPNSVVYEAPVYDPFFLATTPGTITQDGTNYSLYGADRYINVLGCTDQHQFCNPATGRCTELTAWNLVDKAIYTIGLNEVQLNTAVRLGLYMEAIDTYFSVNSRGANALRASETVHSNVQVALPDDQWITEVSSWFAVSLAKLQQKTVQYATGPSYASDGLQLIGPLNKDEVNMCKNQIIRSQGGTISFSVLGISIILIVGGILIVASLVVDTLVGFIRRTVKWKEHKSLQWILDEKLQLQRLAYEEAGQGRWSGCAGSVPVMKEDDRIGVPKHVDKMHPRLSQRSGQSEQVLVFGVDERPEAEGLMAQKQMISTVEYLHE